MAVIPGRAEDHAFVLVNTNDRSYKISYPLSEYRKGEILRIGENSFSKSGVTLNIRGAELALSGEIRYAGLTPIRYDIMGPFRFFPMECRHGVISMGHSLSGAVTQNGVFHDYTGGRGYIESDSGKSFPHGYTWVQCNDFKRDCSIMASVAWIPFCGLRFLGCICVVYLNGREYRLATYTGVKILRCQPGVIELKQGKYLLRVETQSQTGQELAAPRFGRMDHVIRESISCTARFLFLRGDKVLFDEKSDCASYEYEMA